MIRQENNITDTLHKVLDEYGDTIAEQVLANSISIGKTNPKTAINVDIDGMKLLINVEK